MLPPSGAATTADRDLSALGSFAFALSVGEDAVATEIREIYVTSEADGVRISLTPSYDSGSFAVVLGIAAAALHAAGGRYGDDADHEWRLKRVLTEYAREHERFLVEWAAMTPERRAALTAGPRETILNVRATALCAPGTEAELRALLRTHSTTPALIIAVFEAAWRADNPAAVHAAVSESQPAVALEAVVTALNVIGFTGVQQASFLIEKADVLSSLDSDARKSLAARVPAVPDAEVRVFLERALNSARRTS